MPGSCPGGSIAQLTWMKACRLRGGGVVDGAGRRLVTRTLRAGQQHEVRVGGVAGDRFAQRPNRGTVTEQRAFHSAPRVREELLRNRQLARELRVPRLELPSQPLQR